MILTRESGSKEDQFDEEKMEAKNLVLLSLSTAKNCTIATET